MPQAGAFQSIRTDHCSLSLCPHFSVFSSSSGEWAPGIYPPTPTPRECSERNGGFRTPPPPHTPQFDPLLPWDLQRRLKRCTRTHTREYQRAHPVSLHPPAPPGTRPWRRGYWGPELHSNAPQPPHPPRWSAPWGKGQLITRCIPPSTLRRMRGERRPIALNSVSDHPAASADRAFTSAPQVPSPPTWGCGRSPLARAL